MNACLDGEYFVEMHPEVLTIMTVGKYCNDELGQPIDSHSLEPRSIIVRTFKFVSLQT
jgi:hypothetical protein